jgi:hypothetical protein
MMVVVVWKIFIVERVHADERLFPFQFTRLCTYIFTFKVMVRRLYSLHQPRFGFFLFLNFSLVDQADFAADQLNN